MLTQRSQRWRDRRAHFVPAASEIDPRTLAVDVIDTRRVAAPFVHAHHYAGSMPVCRLSVALFRNGGGGRSELAGICAFSVPINNASIPKSAGLEHHDAACDLGRLVLLDDVGGNGESFLVSRAFRLLRRERPGILSVISYADPVRRVDADGRVFLTGHVGTLYAVMGSRYVGRSSPRTDLLLPNGRPLSSRALSKIRTGDTGQRYAIDQIVSSGAPPPGFGESRAAWLQRLECDGASAAGTIQATISMSSRSPRRRGWRPGQSPNFPIPSSIASASTATSLRAAFRASRLTIKDRAMTFGRYMLLSTAHLHFATAETLNAWAKLPAGEQPLAVSTTLCGWFVATNDNGPRHGPCVPDELTAILAFGRAHDCSYILFDCDGPPEPSLPLFPW